MDLHWMLPREIRDRAENQTVSPCVGQMCKEQLLLQERKKATPLPPAPFFHIKQSNSASRGEVGNFVMPRAQVKAHC